ncbi:hypothetical protein [Micromonospora sp. CPCC 206061]|uniref:sulfotransferase-like domain-containing protein n=1 Tax=Micromonospora sp. CPCC 206061 TaxID=3122410 RepID=UPI002FEF13C5
MRQEPDNLLLALWSAPRCRSTAFERMMKKRGDFQVLHEPFSHVADFEEAVVDGRTVRDEPSLVRALMAMKGRVFFKDTTDFRYPHVLTDTAFLSGAVHTFIIRDPLEVIASHAELNARPTRDEIGFSRLAEIFDAVYAATGKPPVVVDSDDLVDRPEATVAAYCARVGIAFDPTALTWPAAEQPEWQRTGRWHRQASVSTGFSRAYERDRTGVRLTEPLSDYYAYHLPYYERLRSHRMPLHDQPGGSRV